MSRDPSGTKGRAAGYTPRPGPGRTERLAHAAHQRAVLLRRMLHRWEARVPRVIGVLRAAFYPCALALVAYMGYQAAREVKVSQLHCWPLAAAFAAAVVWWAALALGWASLVGADPYAAAATWCKTQVARYMPGGIWQIVARAATVKGRVRDKLTAVTAENVLVLLVSLAVGGLWASFHSWHWLPLVVLVAAPLLASHWLEGRTGITRRGLRRTSASYAVGYVAYGLMGVLVQLAVSGPHDLTYPLYVAGASCVAWAIGLVVVFAPGGVGVREVVYVWMLSGLYPRSELEGAAVTSRLVTVAAELLVLALVSRPRRSRSRSADAGTPSGASTDLSHRAAPQIGAGPSSQQEVDE